MSIKPHHFVWSDLHLGHSRILGFGNRDFESVQAHDEFIINKIWQIPAHEVLWILGDAAMDKRKLDRLIGVPCTLGLVGGNHDTFTTGTYNRVFTHICGARVCNLPEGKAIITHIPIHPDEFYRWKWNIHGHLHQRLVNDPRYVSACVEHLPDGPVRISELIGVTNHG